MGGALAELLVISSVDIYPYHHSRRTELEHRLNQASIPNEAREREIRKYRKLESQHLRLRRTKIRLTDFRTIKVIGKGAFGEVRPCSLLNCPLSSPFE